MRHSSCHPRAGGRQTGKQLWKNCYRKSRQGTGRMAEPLSLERAHGPFHYWVPGPEVRGCSRGYTAPPPSPPSRQHKQRLRPAAGASGQSQMLSAATEPSGAGEVRLSHWVCEPSDLCPRDPCCTTAPFLTTCSPIGWGRLWEIRGQGAKPKDTDTTEGPITQ